MNTRTHTHARARTHTHIFFLTHWVLAARSTERLFQSGNRQELSSCFVVTCCHGYSTSQSCDLAQFAPNSKGAGNRLQCIVVDSLVAHTQHPADETQWPKQLSRVEL